MKRNAVKTLQPYQVELVDSIIKPYDGLAEDLSNYVLIIDEAHREGALGLGQFSREWQDSPPLTTPHHPTNVNNLLTSTY